VTFLPLRPLFSLPCFISFISRSTALLALGPYLRPELLFFADDFLLELFFAALFLVVLFLLELFFAEDFLLADFLVPDFFAAFLVAIRILPAIKSREWCLQVAS